MKAALLFVHGWGFDASIWHDLAGHFADRAYSCDERGYFGPLAAPDVAGPVLAVAHSFGAMRVLADPPPGCVGLIAINGFDRFTATDDFPGVATRVVDRMIARLEDDAPATVAAFRAASGSDAPFEKPDIALLRRDLMTLRDGDCRALAAAARFPILSIQSANDAILPPAMRDAVFAQAQAAMRVTHTAAGHLLPVEDPGFCARAITAFAEQAA